MRFTVHTKHVYPPIPLRSFDWMAWVGDYELGCVTGWGATEDAALLDLQNQVEDNAEVPS